MSPTLDTSLEPICSIVPPSRGQVLRAFGDEITIKFSGEQTDGKFTLFTGVTPPGGGPPLHYHLEEDELFIVEEGQMRFFANGKWSEVGPGGVVFAPRRTVHTFTNIGDKPSRMTVMTQPSGFEVFFARCAAECNRPGGPDMERIVAISAEHGIHYVK